MNINSLNMRILSSAGADGINQLHSAAAPDGIKMYKGPITITHYFHNVSYRQIVTPPTTNQNRVASGKRINQ